MKLIHLECNFTTGQVYLNGKYLCPKAGQKLWNHSPDGHSWGYGGSGPAQLALSICLELYGPERAVELHQPFKWQFIAPLPQADIDLDISIINFQ
jgi:hypothetical protein